MSPRLSMPILPGIFGTVSAAELLAEWFGLDANDGEASVQRVETNRDEGNISPLGVRLDLEPEHPYLQGVRGISRATAEHFGIGYCKHGLMAGRIAIPLHDEKGVLVSYSGRSVDGSEPRYLFPAGIKKSRLLYNYYRVKKHLRTTGLIVVEGFFDVFRLYQVAGVRDAVALMGSHASSRQLELLSEVHRVMVIMDGDEAGRTGGEEIVRELKNKAELHAIWMPEGKEPEHLAKEEAKWMLVECGVV